MNIWRVAVRPSYIKDAGFLMVQLYYKRAYMFRCFCTIFREF